MRIQIATQHVPLTDALRKQVQTRLHFILGRLARRVDAALVSFEDVNGPRRGLDVQCRIRLRVQPRGEVNVSAVADSAGTALGAAAQRARRCLTSHVQRRWMQRRRAAQRILSLPRPDGPEPPARAPGAPVFRPSAASWTPPRTGRPPTPSGGTPGGALTEWLRRLQAEVEYGPRDAG